MMKRFIFVLILLVLALPIVVAHRDYGIWNYGVGDYGQNTPPTIDAYQPTNLNPSVIFSTNLTFNVTAIDKDGDALSYNWTINNINNVSNQNLSYIFNTIGVYNVSVNVSDNLSHSFVSWITTITALPAEEEEEEEALPAGGGGAGTVITEEQRKVIEQELLAKACGENASFVNRLFSKCRIQDNGICEDGENYLVNKD